MRNLRQLLTRSGLLSNEKHHRRSEKPRRSDATQRRLSSEVLEKRELLASDMLASQHNYWHSNDVNDDGQITSRDALAIINQLGRQTSGESASGESEGIAATGPRMFYDTNADNSVTAADALSVINALGRGEEVGELIELMLNARTTTDQRILPDANGAINVQVNQPFDLEVSYDDLRTFNSRLGAFQLFTDIQAFDAQGNAVTGFISPVLNETQRLIIDEDILSVSSNSVTFTSAALAPNAPSGSTLTYVSPINAFGGNPTGEVINALRAFGYADGSFTVSTLSFDNDDLGFQVHWVGDNFGNVNLPNISVDVNETNPSDTIATQVIEFAPFQADGVTPNSAAVQFNINSFSRTFNANEQFYSSLNRGQFTPAMGFSDIGGLASQVPLQGGGIPQITDDGMFIEPFDAYSVRVFINQPVTGLRLQLTPGEDREATLLFGRDDFVPQDLVLIENVDSNNNAGATSSGTARLIVNATAVSTTAGVLAISPASLSVNESAGTATFTVNRTGGSTGAVAVSFATANGTATAGSDYTATTGTLSFADGVTSQTITVPITNDTAVESDETFTVTISAPTGGATLGTTTVSTATIVDNDAVATPGVLSLSAATLTVGEAVGTATLTVNRTGGSTGAVTVAFATANGTATAGSDYAATSGTLSFAAGETSKTITVPITNDTAVESNETFTVTISAPTGGATLGTTTVSTVTITDDDTAATPGVLSLSAATLTVGEAAGTATLTVNRTGGSTGAVTVAFATANGTATAGSDYTASTGTLSFAAGETSKTITVPITNDTAVEANETFTVTISAPTGGATLGTTTVSTVTITDNDTAVTPGVLSLSAATLSVGEAAGTATLTVNRTGGSTGAVTVAFATANGTATAGSDYTASTGTLSFAAGETSKTITVPITNDTAVESNETFTVTISAPTGGATLGTTTVSTVTITDNDTAVTPGVLSLSAATLTVGEAAGNATLTVNRTGGSTGAVTVAFATANGTATAGSDYTASTGTLSFAAGETSKTITIPIINDTAVESSETFTVTISAPTGGATLGTTTVSTVTITDNDSVVPVPGVLSISPTTVSVSEGAASATFTVSRTGGSDGAVAVSFATSNVTATAGSDYTATSGTLNFANGVTSMTITVPILEDAIDEVDETFRVTISSPTGGATLGAATVSTATIIDNDPSGPGLGVVSGAVFIDNITNIDAVIKNGAAPVRNGIKDSTDQGLAGIQVRLLDSSGQLVSTVRTDIEGSYSFANVSAGTYTVSYVLPDTVIANGPTSSTVTVAANGAVTGGTPNMTLLGTQGSAIETVDILASSYLRTNKTVSSMSDGGREGGLVSMDSAGVQQFLIVGDGFEGASSVEFVLSNSGTSALLIIVEAGASSPSIARLNSENFVVSSDGRGIQFFGGIEDFSFVNTDTELIREEFSNFQEAIDRAMADL